MGDQHVLRLHESVGGAHSVQTGDAVDGVAEVELCRLFRQATGVYAPAVHASPRVVQITYMGNGILHTNAVQLHNRAQIAAGDELGDQADVALGGEQLTKSVHK